MKIARKPFLHPAFQGTSCLPLTKGFIALIDDSDVDRASRHQWSASVDKYGHVYARCGGGERSNRWRVSLHRYITNAKQGEFVDHIDRNTLDCRKGNLRKAARGGLNVANGKHRATNRSGYRGVSIDKRSGKWRAAISISGKHRHLGLHDDVHDAARAYNRAASEAYGEFAVLNEV